MNSNVRCSRVLGIVASGLVFGAVLPMAMRPPRPNPAPPASAAKLLATGSKQALQQHKSVFVCFGATWCSSCRQLEKLLHRPDFGALFSHHLVLVEIDVLDPKNPAAYNPGGDELMTKLCGKSTSLPCYSVVDPVKGTPVAKRGEFDEPLLSYPVDAQIGQFLTLLDSGSSKFTLDELRALRKILEDDRDRRLEEKNAPATPCKPVGGEALCQ